MWAADEAVFSKAAQALVFLKNFDCFVQFCVEFVYGPFERFFPRFFGQLLFVQYALDFGPGVFLVSSYCIFCFVIFMSQAGKTKVLFAK